MYKDSQSELDKIFMSYNKILLKFKAFNIKTKNGKEITHKDLRKAISVMIKKHPSCRWQSEKIRSRKYYILFEGYLWLMYVYFQSEKNQIDSDIDFFKMRINEYKKLLKIDSSPLWNKDLPLSKLEKYFNRKPDTINRAIIKMAKENLGNTFTYYQNDELIISKEGIEWLCKNSFKHKYLELLEERKMELTEKYIEASFPYDHFFGRN